MPLNQSVGETSLPLDPTLISGRSDDKEKRQIRWAADPLLQKLTEFLSAVVTAEIQPGLDEIKDEQPGTMQVVVNKAIPAAPEKFLNNITRATLPILCVYRAEGAFQSDTLDKQKKTTVWRAEYCMPELEAFEVGSLLGIENAVIDAMSAALKQGYHSAYVDEDDAPINLTESLKQNITPGAFEFSNWQIIEREQAVLFPAARLTFTTVEPVTDNETNSEEHPLENAGVSMNLADETGEQGAVAGFVTSEIHDLAGQTSAATNAAGDQVTITFHGTVTLVGDPLDNGNITFDGATPDGIATPSGQTLAIATETIGNDDVVTVSYTPDAENYIAVNGKAYPAFSALSVTNNVE